MIGLILLLFIAGLFLSALFSGSETGFYRVNRVRLVLDARGGDLVSRMLLRLTNHPALFVATTLIGNNVANYMTSLGIVLLVQQLFHSSAVAETAAPLLLSPLVFVYCELLPKQLFFQAPNRLLRRSGPLLLLFTILFAPVSAVLWVLERFLKRLLGQTPLRIQLALASKELQQVFREGEQAGILHTAQRYLAQRVFDHASENIQESITPLNRVLAVPLGAKADTALHLARRQKSAVIPVHQPGGHALIGYTRVIDLQLSKADRVESVYPLPRIARSESHLGALMQLQTVKADAALVEDRSGNPVGVVYTSQLMETLFPPV